MVSSNPSSRLVKHIIRSYARLAENNRVRAILRDNLPGIFKDQNFYQSLEESSKRWLQNLLKALSNIPSRENDRNNTMQLINGLNANSNAFMMNQSEILPSGAPYTYGSYPEFMEGSNNININMNKSLGYGIGSNGVSNSGSSKNFANFNGNMFAYKNGK